MGTATAGAIIRRLLDVAVSMEELLVVSSPCAPEGLGDDVVDLPAISLGEVQSTPDAPAPLALEQVRDPRRHLRMPSQSGGPIAPIAIIGSLVPPDLDVATDERVQVPPERTPSSVAKSHRSVSNRQYFLTTQSVLFW